MPSTASAFLSGAGAHCRRTLSSPHGSGLVVGLSPRGLWSTSHRYSGLSWLRRLRLRVACTFQHRSLEAVTCQLVCLILLAAWQATHIAGFWIP